MDTPETLAADLIKAAASIGVQAAGVVRKGAQNVKNEARRNSIASSGSSAAAAPQTIGYRTEVGAASIEAVVGYGEGVGAGTSGGGQANLGTLLEFGGGADHSPPHRDLGRALESEEPKFLAAMEAIGVDSLIGRGRR